MKTKAALVFVLLNAGFILNIDVAYSTLVGSGSDITGGSPLNGAGGYGLYQQERIQAEQEWEKEYQAAIVAAEQEELSIIYSKDPWRNIGGTTNLARGAGWVEFQGEVQERVADGAVFKGKFGPVLTVFASDDEYEHLVTTEKTTEENHFSGRITPAMISGDQNGIAQIVQDTSYQRIKIYGDDLFFVQGFPYPATPRTGYEMMMALDSDYFSYTNSTGQVITIHKLIYGTPCVKIWDAGRDCGGSTKGKITKTICARRWPKV
jgi:hypothetical protein